MLLIEVLPWMACALPVIAAAGMVVTSLLRQAALPDGRALDIACDWLRRDARAGVQADRGAVLAGGHRWQVVDGRLLRDDRVVAPAVACRSEQVGQLVRVNLVPFGRLPERRLELLP
jgi:hypothetical protein